jgi:predicted membrane GTPase involved in stress response
LRLVLDAGAFIAVERGDVTVAGLIERSRRNGVPLVTVSPVVAQVWRDGRKQATLARLLAGVDVIAPTNDAAKRAGVLLRRTKMSDAVDALVADLCRVDDLLLTSDDGDLRRLTEANNSIPEILHV